MTIKNYFAFWCPYCKSVQHPKKYKYFGEVGDFYVTRAICPECKKKITLREESVMAAIRRLKWGSEATKE